MKRFVPTISSCLAAVFILACKHNPVNPPPPTKSLRDLIWTTDSIMYPGSFQTNMRSIWASSPQNVYIVGHNDQNAGFMFHYDGKTWSEVPMTSLHGGFINGAIDLTNIYGVDASNIWAVGELLFNNPDPNGPFLDSSLIVKYNGFQWVQEKVNGGRELRAVWGSSPQDIWACGVNTVLHYDGVAWIKDSIGNQTPSIQFLSVWGSSYAAVLMIGGKTDIVNGTAIDTYYLYQFNGRAWIVADSSKSGNEKFGVLLGSVNDNIYSLGYGVWRWTGLSWQMMQSSIWALGGIGGRATNDLLVCGVRDQILHYNGTDWYQFPGFTNPSIDFAQLWSDGSSAFVVGNDGYKTYVARGK